MYPRPWWKIVDWRIVLAVAVPAWLLVGAVVTMTLSKRDKTTVSDKTESFPVSKPVQPPEIIPAPRAVVEVAAAPRQVQIDPAFITALSDSLKKFLTSAPQQPAVAALPARGKLIPEGCQAHGTAVHFVKSPVEAFQEAANREKLVFILHLSGNIEDDGFT
jgi:hypothetical protein